MAFKLGSERREIKNSNNVRKFQENSAMSFQDTPIIRESFEDDTLALANMDGTVSVDTSLDLNSPFGKRVLKHEVLGHIKQIESGDAAYNDNVVMWKGKLYLRREINGESVIDGPNGRHPEGFAKKDENGEWVGHPWEIEAMQAEKKV